ncbi:DNA-binding transcriptional regulator, MarR family [Tumidithrix helvetica PCC 7403]|uniref:MarR family winged helix-turn-helix transcriptional regulator n=1 Tax=Tumidithrix helvetica TaxID=3457545 RepID=UPI003C8E4378
MTALSPKSKTLKKCQSVLAPHGIGYRMRLLTQLTSRKFQEQLDTLEMGLTPFHWVVLCCLWQEDGLATTRIVEKLQQVGGTLTGVLDRMEERGLIYRERDISDRRIWRIWLTDTGKQLQEVLPPMVLQLVEAITLGMTQNERELFSKLVDKMIANLS